MPGAKRNSLPEPKSQYGNPGAGGAFDYWDIVPLDPPAGAAYGDISLMYQPTSFEYQQFLLLANDGSNEFLGLEGVNMFDAWMATGMATPYVMATATWGTPPTGGGCDAVAPTLTSALPGNSQVALEWTDEASGDASITDYKIYYDQAGKAQLVSGVGSTITTFIDSSVNNGTEYCYKVTSYYDANCESDFSNIICAIPNNQGQMNLGVSIVETGKVVTTGKGKNQVTEFIITSPFNVGDEVAAKVIKILSSEYL